MGMKKARCGCIVLQEISLIRESYQRACSQARNTAGSVFRLLHQFPANTRPLLPVHAQAVRALHPRYNRHSAGAEFSQLPAAPLPVELIQFSFFLQLLQKFLACPGMGRIAGHYHTRVRVDSQRCLEACNAERRTPRLIILDRAYFKGILDRILYRIHQHTARCHALLHMLADRSDCHIIGAQTNKSSFQDFNIFVWVCPLLRVHILPPTVAGVVLDRAAAILMPPTLPAARPGMCRSRPVCRTSGSS